MKSRSIRLQLNDQGVYPDTIGKNKAGNYVARWGFFYTHGIQVEKFIREIKSVLPEATIMNAGEKWTAFRGGASTAAQSHWWVEFRVAEKSSPKKV